VLVNLSDEGRQVTDRVSDGLRDLEERGAIRPPADAQRITRRQLGSFEAVTGIFYDGGNTPYASAQ
jgi:hypothetical protein